MSTRSFRRSQASLLRSYLAGLTLSTAGSSASFGIAAGVANDSTNADTMLLAAAITKTTGAFVAGSGNGALDTGSILASTWYWAFLIENTTTGAVDVCITKAVAGGPAVPTLPTGFTLYRYIGSMKTNGSSQWTKFTQLGDDFLWDQSVQLDANVTTLTSPGSLFILTVPLGVQVWARVFALALKAATNLVVNLTSPDQSDNTTFSLGYGILTPSAGTEGSVATVIRTDTSARIRATSSAAGTTFQLTTDGWTDRRGRDA